MVDAELLSLLCCPETHQGLRQAGAQLLQQLNQKVVAGTLRTLGGRAVSENVIEGLLREDGKILYPIRDNIPVLLAEEAISLEPHGSGKSTT